MAKRRKWKFRKGILNKKKKEEEEGFEEANKEENKGTKRLEEKLRLAGKAPGIHTTLGCPRSLGGCKPSATHMW